MFLHPNGSSLANDTHLETNPQEMGTRSWLNVTLVLTLEILGRLLICREATLNMKTPECDLLISSICRLPSTLSPNTSNSLPGAHKKQCCELGRRSPWWEREGKPESILSPDSAASGLAAFFPFTEEHISSRGSGAILLASFWTLWILKSRSVVKKQHSYPWDSRISPWPAQV